MSKQRVVCLNCMDGRIQIPVINWISDNYDIDYVDMITEPGMDGILSDESRSLEDIFSKVQISIDKNNAAIIFVVAHYDCRGNPVSEETHKKELPIAVSRLQNKFSNLKVVGLWVNSSWKVEKWH